MKKKDDFLNDIYNQINNEDVELPVGLSKEKIVRLVKGRKQEDKKTNIKKLVAVAASFAVVITAVAIGIGLYNPQVVPVENIENKEVYTASEYKQIEDFFISLRNNYRANYNSNNSGQDTAEKLESAASGSSPSADKNILTNESLNETSSGDFSQTHLQDKNVDEADIVKNDGRYLYITSGTSASVHIVDAQNPSDLKKTAEINVKSEKNESINVENIYIKGNKLIVIAMTYNNEVKYNGKSDCYVNFEDTSYMALVYDITDKSAPKKISNYSIEGNGVSSRLSGDKLILISNYCVPLYKDDSQLKNECIPSYYINGNQKKIAVQDINIIKENKENTYTLLLIVDVENNDKEPECSAVLGGTDKVYCNDTNLYVSRNVYNQSDNGAEIFSLTQVKTAIYSFGYSDSLEYKTQAEVEGEAINQFAMDEYNGYFRIATSKRNSESSITVFDKDLKVVGSLPGIAKGESIFAVRFFGDTAYVVTFLQTDPLFVINLSNPAEPFIEGELKIPGFSNMLYPYSDKYIIGIGKDGTQSGANNKTKISLFDISDRANPKEVSKAVFNEACYSPAEYDHKAFITLGESGEFLIPINIYQQYNSYNGARTNDPRNYVCMLSVNGDKLEVVNKYTISSSGEVIRGAYTGDTIFAVSEFSVTAFDRKTAQPISTLELIKYQDNIVIN